MKSGVGERLTAPEREHRLVRGERRGRRGIVLGAIGVGQPVSELPRVDVQPRNCTDGRQRMVVTLHVQSSVPRDTATATRDNVKALADAAASIGDVVKLISAIAEQTQKMFGTGHWVCDQPRPTGSTPLS